MLAVHWAKNSAGDWHKFEAVDLTSVGESGVYVIWYGGERPASVCVGHGDIATRLCDRQTDRAILMYRKLGVLYATWAEVPVHLQQGVARFLTEKLQPPFGDMLLLVPPVAVEIPNIAGARKHSVHG